MSDTIADGFFHAKRVLVCGPGYVGGAVVRALRQRGARVCVISRSSERLQPFIDLGCEGRAADLASTDWHGAFSAEFDFVLNAVSSGGGGLAGYRRSYAEGMASLMHWASGCDSGAHFIYTGSTSVYGGDGGALVDERAAANTMDERSEILRETESTLHAFSGKWTVLRLAGIYGPGRHHLLDQLRAGEPIMPGRGDIHLNLIHRDDIVAAILRVWERSADSVGQTFNLADAGEATKGEVVHWLADRLGRERPAFSGVSAPGRRAHLPDRIISGLKIARLLDWHPRYPTFREGYTAILGA